MEFINNSQSLLIQSCVLGDNELTFNSQVILGILVIEILILRGTITFIGRSALNPSLSSYYSYMLIGLTYCYLQHISELVKIAY